MKPSSCKSKGRRFQQAVRDYLQSEFSDILQVDDVRSCSMGASGNDILLSPLAKAILPFAFELKNVESPSVGRTLRQAQARLENDTIPVCVFGRNKVKLQNALVVIPESFFCRLFTGKPFDYDFTKHALIPTISDLHCEEAPFCDMPYVDFSNSPWSLQIHDKKSFNLWEQWKNLKAESNDLPLAIQIFSRNEDLRAHVVLTLGHFVRLVKTLWLQSSAHKRLIRPSPALSSPHECIIIDD